MRPIGNARIVAVSAQSTVVNAPSTSGQESLSARIASPVLQAALGESETRGYIIVPRRCEHVLFRSLS